MNPRTPPNGKGDTDPSELIQPGSWNTIEDSLTSASAAAPECWGNLSNSSPSMKENTDQFSPR